MKEKEAVIKKLRLRLIKNKRLMYWQIFLLILQFLIWWICNPGFIPALSEPITHIQEFLLEFLLPQNRLDTESYRYYISLLCQWVKELSFYPTLSDAAPYILPGWYAATLLHTWYLRLRIKHLQTAPQPKKSPRPRQKKKYAIRSAVQWVAQKFRPKATESGLFAIYRNEANQAIRTLQAQCSVPHTKDQGIWFSNFAPTGGKAPADKILHWDSTGAIVLPDAGNVRFELIEDQAYLIGEHNGQLNRFPMQKGIPLVLTHKNEAGQDILCCTATWLGGVK